MPPAIDEILAARHDGQVAARFTVGHARTAEPVDRDAEAECRIARVERRHAAEVAALLADLAGCAPDHVVDVGGVEPLRSASAFSTVAASCWGWMSGERALADACRCRAACGRRR